MHDHGRRFRGRRDRRASAGIGEHDRARDERSDALGRAPGTRHEPRAVQAGAMARKGYALTAPPGGMESTPFGIHMHDEGGENDRRGAETSRRDSRGGWVALAALVPVAAAVTVLVGRRVRARRAERAAERREVEAGAVEYTNAIGESE